MNDRDKFGALDILEADDMAMERRAQKPRNFGGGIYKLPSPFWAKNAGKTKAANSAAEYAKQLFGKKADDGVSTFGQKRDNFKPRAVEENFETRTLHGTFGPQAAEGRFEPRDLQGTFGAQAEYGDAKRQFAPHNLHGAFGQRAEVDFKKQRSVAKKGSNFDNAKQKDIFSRPNSYERLNKSGHRYAEAENDYDGLPKNARHYADMGDVNTTDSYAYGYMYPGGYYYGGPYSPWREIKPFAKKLLTSEPCRRAYHALRTSKPFMALRRKLHDFYG